MRRFIGFILLLALITTARGQTAYSYRYWFDNNLATLHTGTANGETTIEMDISSLTKGSVHALHLQGLDARKKWSAVRTQYFFIAKDVDTKSATARYWYDNDETTAKAAPTVNGTINLDISHMDIGTHSVHCQTFNAKGEASPVRTQYFYMNELQRATLSAKIWIDDNESEAQTFALTDEDIVLDVSYLTVGMHEVHVTLYDARGSYLGEGSAEFEVPIPMTTITLSAAGIGTFCWDVDVDFSNTEDVKAYIATGYNNKTAEVTLGRVKDVPAGTGVLLLGNEGEYQVPQLPSYSYYMNMLVGVNEPTAIRGYANGYANYILQTGQYGISFYQNDYTVDAGTAYLHVPSTQAGAKQRIRIIFDDDVINGFGKGRLTLSNITSLIDTYLGENGLPKSVADVDADGKITIEDITKLILMYLESDDK
ncbi:MAG: hypothetical protein IJT97_07840 [Bacteroidaceae bacterium]|nr:hypothetical protein [Bacteroidaceae bacterium]